MSDYLARPKPSLRGGILVIHAWWGLNGFFENLCDRLAAQGYVALAPDLYDGAVAQTIPEAEKLRDQLKRKTVEARILEALKELQAEVQAKPVGVAGFSLGAYFALGLVEQNPKDIAATILFYGTRGMKDTGTRSAFLGHFAENDEYESASSRKKLEKTLKTAGKETTFHVYPGTRHWFFEDDRPEFDPPAAELAWQRTIAFLKDYLA